MSVPRVRMFAGPNGSGKSTIKAIVEELAGTKVNFGHDINPDEIAAGVGSNGCFDFGVFNIEPSPDELMKFLRESTFLNRQNLLSLVAQLSFEENRLNFSTLNSHIYIVSVLCDFVRHELLRTRQTLTFTTSLPPTLKSISTG